jgi:hypothetical protein
VLCDSVQYILPWCSPQGFLVRIGNGCNRTVRIVFVAGEVGRIVWAVMMVGETAFIETINYIGAVVVLLSKMMGTVCRLLFLTEGFERSDRLVPRVALTEGATTSKASAVDAALVLGRIKGDGLAGPSRPTFIQGAECFCAMAAREVIAAGACRVGRRRIAMLGVSGV